MIKCSVDGLSKTFRDKRVVDNVSLAIEEGEFIVILGPSGCGKTTTLRLIAGLEIPDEGTIAIDSRLVSAPAQHLFVRPEHRGVGMVFQSYAVWPHMSVFENVAFPLRVRRLSTATIRGKVAEVLDLVGLSGEAERSATALSGGQMQRVALARALVSDPALLLFDEPLSNLDLKLRERLRVELKALQRRTGLTSIYVTHDQTEAVELGDRILVMDGGKAVQLGPPATLFRQPQSRFVAEFIGSANIVGGLIERVLSPDSAEVRLSNGSVTVGSHDGSIAVGQPVDIVVHPEDCSIRPANDPGVQCFQVRIVESRYLGSLTRYTIDWGGVRFEGASMGTSAGLPQDSTAWLYLAPQQTRIIAREAR